MFSTEIESCFSGSRTSIIVIDGKSKHGQFVYLLSVSIQRVLDFERTPLVRFNLYETWGS